MKPEAIRALALDILGGIAPEADLDTLTRNDDLREALDLDSMDFLNFVAALHKASGTDVPEADYGRLLTLAGIEEYFSQGEEQE